MPAPAFIAGDWGTTHLRLFLCDESGKVLDTQNGAGVSGLRDDVGGAFFRAVEGWDRAHGKFPAVLCGMVGSTIGWREVAYLNCPARPEAIAKSTLCFAAEGRPIAIAPGLTCRNRLLARVAAELATNLGKYAEHGFAPFAAEWQRRHAYQGKPVRLLLPDGESVKGTVAGVDSTGALVLADGPRRARFLAGEISLRRA